MKQSVKKFLGLSLVCLVVVSTSMMPQASFAQQANKKNEKKSPVSYSQSKSKQKKQNGTKNILVIKNTKKKKKGVNYPDFICKDDSITYPGAIKKSDDIVVYPQYLYPMDNIPTIIDREDAYDYLYDVLSNIKQYNLDKNIIEVEEFEEFPFAGEVEEWYFGYGPEIKGDFFPERYFAVNENGDIFEYNFEKDAWFVLAVAYQK